jgi:hypothetical protein
MAEQEKIEKTPMEAKQGIELFRIRYVLIISLGLAIAGMIVGFVFAGKF